MALTRVLQISLLLTVAAFLVSCESAPKILRDPSFLQLLSKHFSGLQPSRPNSGYGSDASYQSHGHSEYRPQEESYYDNTAYSSNQYNQYSQYPYGSKLPTGQQTDNLSENEPTSWKQNNYPVSSQEYWTAYSPWNNTNGYRPTAAGSYVRTNATYSNQDITYGRPSASVTAPGYSYVRNNQVYDIDGSHSMVQYQHARPMMGSYSKKSPVYYGKNKVVKISNTTKPKYKKNPAVYYSNPMAYKKMYPRIHTPYVHKQPTKKAVHPYYRRFFQYPYGPQQYPMSPNEMPRNKVKKQNGYYDPYAYYRTPEVTTYAPEVMATPTTSTERMGDIHSEKPTVSEDYTSYNDTYHKSNRINNYTNYYESYEEPESETSTEENANYEYEATTRGYYGDRIYMSTQVPASSTEKPATKHRLYFVRSEAHDDDIETIFE